MISIGGMMIQFDGGKRVAITGPIADKAEYEGYVDESEDNYVNVDWVTSQLLKRHMLHTVTNLRLIAWVLHLSRFHIDQL